MVVTSVKNKNKLTFFFYGELDEHNAPTARSIMDYDIINQNFDTVVLDFKNLSFMDSTGIGVIIGRYKKLIAKQIPIFVANVSPHIDKIFKTTGIYSIIKKII